MGMLFFFQSREFCAAWSWMDSWWVEFHHIVPILFPNSRSNKHNVTKISWEDLKEILTDRSFHPYTRWSTFVLKFRYSFRCQDELVHDGGVLLIGRRSNGRFGQNRHPECPNVNIFLMSFWRFISTQLAKPVPQAFENVGKSWHQIRLIFRLSSCIGNSSC